MAATTDKAVNANAEKMKALQLTLDKLDKNYGKGTVMKLSDNKVMDVEVISTGSLGLDIALGVGGLPKGRVIELYGPESSGKTTLTLHAIVDPAARSSSCSTRQARPEGRRAHGHEPPPTLHPLNDRCRWPR